MKTRLSWITMSVLLLCSAGMSLSGGAARAADLRDAGRQLVQQYQQAIVTVRVVASVKVSMSGQEQPEHEAKNETSGTVIGPDGLTLIPLSEIDPSSQLARLRGEDTSLKVDSQIKDVKILMPDLKEIPATVVLRDKDLDIAFVRPTEKPATPMKSVSLSGATDVNLLDQVLVVARLGRIADRTLGAMTGEIQAIVAKPRKFYVPSAELASGGLGVPIFTADSKLVGFIMLRTIAGTDEEGGPSAMPIIIPASQIAEIAKQAPEKAETPKAAPEKTETPQAK